MLVVEDDGVGFDVTDKTIPRDKGIGLAGMQERAGADRRNAGGRVAARRQGTSVYLSMPIAGG